MKHKLTVVMLATSVLVAVVSWFLSPTIPSIRLVSFYARENVAIFDIANHSNSPFSYLGFGPYDACVTFRFQTPSGVRLVPQTARFTLPSYQTIPPRGSVTCSVDAPADGSFSAISVGMHFKPGPAEEQNRLGQGANSASFVEKLRRQVTRYLAPPAPTWSDFVSMARADTESTMAEFGTP